MNKKLGASVVIVLLAWACSRAQPSGAESPASTRAVAASSGAAGAPPPPPETIEPLPPKESQASAPAAAAAMDEGAARKEEGGGLPPQRPAPARVGSAKAKAEVRSGKKRLPSNGEPGASGQADLEAERQWDDPLAAFEALQVNYESFGSALELQTPDCPAAASLRDTICQLAERICRLEAELVSSQAPRRCAQGRQRCAAARSEYAQGCE